MRKIQQYVQSRWEEFCKATLENKLSMIAFLSLCFFFFDCSFTGGGHYLAVGPLTPRVAAALIALLCSVPVLLKNIRKYIKNPIVLMVIVFAVYLGICAVRGYLAKNRMNVLLSDIKGFAWLFMVPVTMAILNSRARFTRVVNCVIVGSVLQACFVFVVNIVCTFVPDGIKIFYQPMIDTMIGTVSSVSGNIFRIFMKSSPYMILSCGVLLYRQVTRKKVNGWQLTMIAMILNALLLSFTRSVYGCIIVVFACVFMVVVILHRDAILRCIQMLLLILAITLSLVTVQELVLGGNYFHFALSRTFGTHVEESPIVELRGDILDLLNGGNFSAQSDDDNSDLTDQEAYIDITEKSDNLRAQTKAELKAIIARNPIFGSGLGASVPSRESGLDEYFYLDVLARMGIVGLILYVFPFAYVVIVGLKKRKELMVFHDGCGVVCGMVGFWAITWFNPWMNAVLGIACYALCTAIPQNLTDTE